MSAPNQLMTTSMNRFIEKTTNLEINTLPLLEMNPTLIETNGSSDCHSNNFIESLETEESVEKPKSELTTQITAVLAEEDVLDNSVDKDCESELINSGSNSLKCKVCCLELNGLQDMRRHIRLHSEDKPFKCSQCDQTFNVEVNLKLHTCAQHYQQSTTGSEKLFCCECNKSFTRLASLRAHLVVHQREEVLTCGQCSQQFCSHYYLNKHINNIHLNVFKKLNPKSGHKWMGAGDQYLCSVCDQRFANVSQLREHQKLHSKIKCSLRHRTYKKCIDRSGFRHQCSHCGKTFKKNSQLIRHLRIHTGEKPFVCQLCGSAFNQKNSLDIHKTKHTGERRYRCRFCSAQFNQSGNMRSHIERLHAPQANIPAEQLFKCPFCNCVFKRVGILNCHISRRHPSDAIQTTNDLNKKLFNGLNVSLISGTHGKSQVEEDLGDLLSKALERSGVTPLDTQMGDKQIAQLFDPATGARQTHIVRRDGKLSFRICVYCSKEFKKSSDLVRHLRIHTHMRPYRCSLCYRSFTVKGTLSAHMRTHDGLKPYPCALCNKSFSTSQSLKVHNRLHTGAQPYTCSLCLKKFRTLGHLRSHSMVHQRQPSGQYLAVNTLANSSQKCNALKHIDETVLSNIQLDDPVLVSADGMTVINCKRPTKQKEVELNDKRKFRCSLCEKGFKKSSHLAQHLRSHTGEKPFHCPVCERSFVAKGSLKIHLQTHSGVKPFKCNECEWRFSTRGSLTRHMTRHQELKPYLCPYCGRAFKSNINCKKHIKLHRKEFALQLMSGQQENNPNLNPNSNNDINRVRLGFENSSSIDAIDNHMMITIESNDSVIDNNHNNSIDSTSFECNRPLMLGRNNSIAGNVRPFMCQVCGQAFKKSSHLTSHFRRHTGEKPFECQVCERRFATKGVLNTHINTHSTEKNYRCSTCSATFVTNNSLRRHMNSVHTTNSLLCTQCSLQFESQSALRKHIQCQHQNITVTDKCLIEEPTIGLSDKMVSTPLLEICEKEVHSSQPTTDRLVVFEVLNQITQTTDHLVIHSNKCDFCPKSFKKPSDLVRHRRTHTGEKPFVCSVCKKCFAVKSTLDTHLATHMGLKNFKCLLCDTSFATKGSLNVHQRLHSGLKPFECNECKETFRTSGQRKSHIDSKHKKTGVKCIGNTCDQLIANSGPTIELSVCGPPTDDNLINNTIGQSGSGETLMRVALMASQNQSLNTYQMDSTLFSQLFQMDSTYIQGLSSHNFVITDGDHNSGSEPTITSITTTALF